MKTTWRRFAPFGLYLALVAGLVSIGLGIVFQTWGLPLQISLSLTVIGLALFGVLDPDKVRSIFTGRHARYTGNLVVMSIAFIGILVVVNYLFYQASILYPNVLHVDLTEDKVNTLAPETVDVLDNLSAPVQAQAFYTQRNTSVTTAISLLDQYKENAKGKFSYEILDPEEKIEAAKAANLTGDGQILIKMGDRQQLVTIASEQELTSGLIRLMSSETRAVYFLSGSGEHTLEGSEDTSLSQAKTALEDRNYVVQELKLRATGVIPEDARVIVVAGPTKPVSQEEVNLLAAFLNSGGALVVMEDPLPWTEFGAEKDPLADYLALNWGILLGNDVIIRVASNQPAVVAEVYQVNDHPITSKLVSLPPVFPGVRSVRDLAGVADVTVTELVFTTPFFENCYPYCAWAATDLTAVTAWLMGQSDVPQPSAEDIFGPVPMAASSENATTQGRVVVIGDSDFATNAFLKSYGNEDMLNNVIDWAAGQEEIISLTARQTTQRLLVTPLSQAITKNLLLLGGVILLPGLVIFLGVVAWLVRRGRG